ncbi:uncharacterized protein BX663DRAFT_510948 [Cokeromyces recurvatus]|uniref:uncharacterized protein n=1 Tax=Cokeromyces recurvatus TaxID=90255 RepID=UPI002220209A|nr:uncharacterized protein BX663DRAFT_510948 [Cokeromyces recurvatus]KAI7902392.1 hypothetical protein BX663DRAFT_510948 [Cokeromyces recurvatus]
MKNNNNLYPLPSEIIWNIIQKLEPKDLSVLRVVSKRTRMYCDHPSLWENIQLNPNNYLWKLSNLKSILQSHLHFIRKIQIWNVRDSVVRYILENCCFLEDLAIFGWSTLSDHAFRTNQKILYLKSLKLIGERKLSFVSMDAFTFGKFIKQCPQLEEVSILRCQIHLHSDSLLEIFSLQNNILSSLKFLTMPTKRSWTSQNIIKLFELCSNLEILKLIPNSDQFLLNLKDRRNNNNKMLDVSNSPLLIEKSLQSIEDEELLVEVNNIIIYRILN